MRKSLNINQGWSFRYHDGTETALDLPHTWNALDGQDGGGDYWRGTCTYKKSFSAPSFGADECVYLDFAGVNASAKVMLNGQTVMTHDGGYSTFRCDITDHLKSENELVVEVDNSKNDRVYPQKADFTFYGGIYRDVKLLIVNKNHFDLDHFGGPGIAVSAEVKGKDANVWVRTWHNTQGTVSILIRDAQGQTVARGEGTDTRLPIEKVHLWDGLRDPYLYTCEATLFVGGRAVDRVSTRFGCRYYHVDPKKGFFLNGRSYPLRGVCRHQDWKGIGNALTKAHHDADMAIIKEIGATTLRCPHYQHDQYWYDLCDEAGLIVWAEIPYISEHMPNGRANTISQMKELVIQNYNHPSICVWGLSNEITISTKDKKDMMDNHRVLNDLVHELDPSRPTTLACYSVCGPFNPVAHKVSDLVSWNLYLGWYVPGMFLNELWVDFFHKIYPDRCLGYSEYGCECMPQLHTDHPRRLDQSEEYQCKYHEHMLRFFDKRPFMWATHLWNTFDFAADARNQGGEPGMNHKGLVTFDRHVKKDAFYLYKAWWSTEPFVYIAGRRFVDRPNTKSTVTVYSNQPEVTLYINGKKHQTLTGGKVFRFPITVSGEMKIEAKAGSLHDKISIRKVDKPNPDYRLGKDAGNAGDWV